MSCYRVNYSAHELNSILLQLEFVIQLLSRKDTVIALVRDPSSATQLQAIDNPKLHILQADVTDAVSVKVNYSSHSHKLLPKTHNGGDHHRQPQKRLRKSLEDR